MISHTQYLGKVVYTDKTIALNLGYLTRRVINNTFSTVKKRSKLVDTICQGEQGSYGASPSYRPQITQFDTAQVLNYANGFSVGWIRLDSSRSRG